jgi:hypothetical protein
MGRRPSENLEGQAQHPSATVLGRDGHGRLGRARLRGTKFEVQALLAAVAHNVKQLAISRQKATAVSFGRLPVAVGLSAPAGRL